MPTATNSSRACSSASAEVGREVQPVAVALDQLREPRLPDRDPALLEALDLGLVDVDAPDVVAELGEAGGGDQADVAVPMTPIGSLFVEWLMSGRVRVSRRRYCLSRVSDSAIASIWRLLSDCESVFDTQ